MNLHRKKMIAPIVVSIVVVLYYVIYFCFLMVLLEGFWKYLLGIFPIALSAFMIGVCIDRIKEIKRGEEDDLSQY